MTCDSCAKDHLYNPACLYCGARLIYRIGRLQAPREVIQQRRRTVLADWMGYGHSEADLRALAKTECFGQESSTVSVPQKEKKPRSVKRK